jgi:hypothetical protein
VSFGNIWHRKVGLGLDPAVRRQELIRLIFAGFRELSSARQVLLSMKADRIHLPEPSDEGRMTNFEWMPIRYPQCYRGSSPTETRHVSQIDGLAPKSKNAENSL